jgi:hypothetical protein
VDAHRVDARSDERRELRDDGFDLLGVQGHVRCPAAPLVSEPVEGSKMLRPPVGGRGVFTRS